MLFRADGRHKEAWSEEGMKQSWSVLLIIASLLSFATYWTTWVVVGELAPLWLRVIMTVSVGSGIVLMIVQNKFVGKSNAKVN